MGQTTGRNLPPPQSAFVEKTNLNLSYDGYQYLLSLLNAAASVLPTATIDPAIAGAGTTQATATLLKSQWNVVTAGAANSGVLLQLLQPGQSQNVINATGGSIKVYPPSSVAIDVNPQNIPYVLTAGMTQIFNTISAASIRSTQLQVP